MICSQCGYDMDTIECYCFKCGAFNDSFDVKEFEGFERMTLEQMKKEEGCPNHQYNTGMFKTGMGIEEDSHCVHCGQKIKSTFATVHDAVSD